MLRVQLPPEPLAAWYANWQSGQVESLVMVCGFNSHPRYHVSAGHWRAQVAVTHPQSLCRFNSCPTHWARSTSGEVAGLSSRPDGIETHTRYSVGCVRFSGRDTIKKAKMLARKPNAPYQEWPSGGMADASGSEPDVREDVPVQVRPRLLEVNPSRKR